MLLRAMMSAADLNDLPDSAFAYIEPGGSKDEQGKTVPRSKRHFPIHDEAHVRNALARAPQSPFGDKAMPKIMAAAEKYGIEMMHDGRSALRDVFLRMFDEQSHPRAPKGSDTGGQFAKAGSGGQKPQAKNPPGKPAARPQAAKKRPAPKKDDGTLSYDPSSNHGTGYNSPKGDPRVHRLQQALTRLGLTDGAGKVLKDDGKLGPKTTAAVKKAQRRLGLPQDGKVTPALLEKLVGLQSLPRRRSAMLDLCVRSFGFEFDERAKGDGRTLEGYAAVFNTPARIRDVGGDFEETILPGAFTRSLGERMPILQWDHGKDPRVGTVPIGAIEQLGEDSKGLHVRARLFDNTVVEPVRQAIEAKAIKGMSFRFGVPDGGDEWPSRDQRHVRDADVHELGPVAFPAYDATSVSVRSLLAQLDPTEHAALIRELVADLRLAVDLEDFTGQSDARSDDGGDTGAEPDAPPAPQLTDRQRLDDGALRARGILK